MTQAASAPNHTALREAVATEALAWLGTPYHHRARVRGVGVDCAHLLLAAYQPHGFALRIEPGHYPTDWHLHHSSEQFEQWLQTAGAVRQPATALPLLSDIIIWQFGRCYSHGSIYVGDASVVHSYRQQGVIVTRMDEAPLQGVPHHIWRAIGAHQGG